MHLPIIVEQDKDDFYVASCLAFKGCRSYGKTIEEALENIRQAVERRIDAKESEAANRFIGFCELEVQL